MYILILRTKKHKKLEKFGVKRLTRLSLLYIIVSNRKGEIDGN